MRYIVYAELKCVAKYFVNSWNVALGKRRTSPGGGKLNFSAMI